MSLSAGQQAILRALESGREITYMVGITTNQPIFYFRDNYVSINGNTARSLKQRGYIQHPILGPGQASAPVTLTDKGHAALRALEQEAGG